MRLARLLSSMLIVAASMCTFASAPSQLEQNWRDYLASATDAPIAMRFPHQACFDEAARRHGIPVSLLLAVARGESDFDASARSKADAYGVMQILWPGTAGDLGITSMAKLLDPCTNIDAGARYLSWLLDRYDGDLHLALAAYNYGPGRIRQDEVVPEGAEWYSGYIYQHLGYVLGNEDTPAIDDYARECKQLIIAFNRPYRAAAFAELLQRNNPDMRLETFRRFEDRFEVRLLYVDSAERDAAEVTLREMGIVD